MRVSIHRAFLLPLNFRCSRAQQLFNLLQSYVRQPVPDHSSQPPATATGHSGRLNSIDIDQDRVVNPELPAQYETQISSHDDPNILPSGDVTNIVDIGICVWPH